MNIQQISNRRRVKSEPAAGSFRANLAKASRSQEDLTQLAAPKVELHRHFETHPTTHETHTNTLKMVKPITGMLRRGLVLDLSVAFGTSSPILGSIGRHGNDGEGGLRDGNGFENTISTFADNVYRSRYCEWLLLVVRYVVTILRSRDSPSRIPSGSPHTTTRKSNSNDETFEPRPEKTTNSQRTGYHVPAVRRRDLFYAKLEDQRAEALGQV
jgi:ribosomal protein S15P/S13E